LLPANLTITFSALFHAHSEKLLQTHTYALQTCPSPKILFLCWQKRKRNYGTLTTKILLFWLDTASKRAAEREGEKGAGALETESK